MALQADDRNNKQLVDDGTAQALTQDEIQQMKRDGKSGEEIVKAIAAASATLSTKTAFSQARRCRGRASTAARWS